MLRECKIMRRVLWIVLRVERLDPVNATTADVLNDFIIPDELGVREHCHAARLVDEADDLRYLQTIVRHIGGPSLLQEFGKRVAHRLEISLADEHASNMRAADGLACTGHGKHIFLADVVAELLQLRDHLAEARPARLRHIVELVCELAVIDIYIVAEDMDLLRRVMRRELNTGNDANPLRRIETILIEMCHAVDRIMIRDGEIAEPCLPGSADEFLRRELAIGKCCMGMQIAWHSSFSSSRPLARLDDELHRCALHTVDLDICKGRNADQIDAMRRDEAARNCDGLDRLVERTGAHGLHLGTAGRPQDAC